ncbi:MAG: hypothetical protein HRU29_04010 [Rhizobiales bacterium]|nr:hypothetical protein [Hyphomicrobiales bacterium]NRB13546.1 hypothetical protein [Hyphomicrobiales bacterium]
MKLAAGFYLKFIMVIAVATFLSSCSSTGGFGEMIGISNEGIDANNVETNAPLVQANGSELPTPQGNNDNIKVAESSPNFFNFFGLFDQPQATEAAVVEPLIVDPITGTPKIIAPKIVAPTIATPKITKAVVIGKPIPRPAIMPVVKVEPKPEVKPEVKLAVVSKIAPKDYKFTDLFTFRTDMRAGKMVNPLATAALVAAANASCKLEGKKFTCGEYFITIE